MCSFSFNNKYKKFMEIGYNQYELLNQHLNELVGRTMWHSIKNNLEHDIWSEFEKTIRDKVYILVQRLNELRINGNR